MPGVDRYRNPVDRKAGSYDYTDELRTRKEQFEKALRYYKGDQPGSLYTEEDGVDDNIVINYSKQAVDRTTSFLFPEMPQFELTGNDQDSLQDAIRQKKPKDMKPEEYLAATFHFNGGVTLLGSMAFNGALSGHVFVRVLPPDPFDEDTYPFPRLIVLDPRQVIAHWKHDNINRIVWYEIRWTMDKKDYLQDIYLDEVMKTWEIVDYEYTNGGGWNEINRVTWRSHLSPIIHWQHLTTVNEFYGMGELTDDQLKLNDAINRVASDLNRIIRFHAFPRTIGTGVDGEEIQPTKINGVWTVTDPNAEIYNLEMKSDLSASSNFLTLLMDNFLASARVVIIRGQVADFQRVTNTGIRAVFLDMIAKGIILRSNYGVGLQKICQRLLQLGMFDFEIRPDVLFADPLPTDDTEAINTLNLERQMGIVSHESASKKRGYYWDDENKKMEQEAKELAERVPEPKAEGGGSIATDKNKTTPLPSGNV